jgi:hypothetical protein
MRKCIECEKEFKIKNTNKTQKFCSIKCSNKYKKKLIPHNKQPIVKLICLGCNNEFEVPTWRAKQNPKYCSYECYWENKTRTKQEREAHSKKLKEYYKTHKSYWTGKKRGKTPKHVREKLSEALRGEKSYQWKGGVSKLYETIRKTDIYKDWSTKVFERDKYLCQQCKNNNIKYLNVHHKKTIREIIKDNNIKTKWDSYSCKELWDLNNGITLCVECHKKEHKKR